MSPTLHPGGEADWIVSALPARSMKRCLLWFFAFALAGALAAAPPRSTIQLDDGRVLEAARILSQTATTVTIAYTDGIVQVEKELLPPELRARYPSTPAPAVESRPAPIVEVKAAPPPPVTRPASPDATPAPVQAPAQLPPPAALASPAVPTITVTATYLWRDALGAATPLEGAHGFAVERATFLDWAARRREEFAGVGRPMLLEYVRAEGQEARDAARERLEQFVAKSVGEAPAAATRLVVNENGQFSITAPAGRPFVVVMTATRRDGPRIRYMTWFDLIDGTADRRVVRDVFETSVGDWNFAE